jgi:hypothetical protein
MDREKALMERIRNEITQLGVTEKDIYLRSENGIGDCLSYFEVLLELKLRGEEYSNQQVWEEMKKQLNFFRGVAAKASEDYLKLTNKYRDLEEHIKWIEKERNSVLKE